ncbi:MAG: hypothetical protein J6I34_04125, partial [Prevotella sp.]|nr:hypothetical protein [Prevotella sp.]
MDKEKLKGAVAQFIESSFAQNRAEQALRMLLVSAKEHDYRHACRPLDGTLPQFGTSMRICRYRSYRTSQTPKFYQID